MLLKTQSSKIAFLICLVLLIHSCKDEIEVKPMKYNRHGENLKCQGYYINQKIDFIVCKNTNGDTILKEDFVNGKRQGKSIMYYPNGTVKEDFTYLNGFRHGKQYTYFPSGKLQALEITEISGDTSYLMYEKIYDEMDTLQIFRLPLRFKTNPENDYRVNKKYRLYVNLICTEYDSVVSVGVFKENKYSSIKTDTSVFEGASIFVDFIPTKLGKNKIEGEFWEINAKNPEPEYRTAIKNWTFEYEVNRK